MRNDELNTDQMADPERLRAEINALEQRLTKLRGVLAVIEGRMPQAAGLASGRSLSHRQAEVAQLMAQGLSNLQIAQTMGISESTVRVHASAVLKTLGVANRTQVAVWWAKRGAAE